MANKPFFAVHNNIVDESSTTTTPSVIGTNPVLITRAQQRCISDTLTTSVQGNPITPVGTTFQQPQHISYNQNGFLQANPQLIPGGVVFRFNSQNNYPPSYPFSSITQQFNNPFSQGLTLEQNMALCDIQAHGLETLLMQERMKRNPFVLQFHQNRSTSTGDLMNGPSMAQPDFNAASAFRANFGYPMQSTNVYSKTKQLNLPDNHKDKQPTTSFITAYEDKYTMTEYKHNSTHNVRFEDENKEMTEHTSEQKDGKTVQQTESNNHETNESTTDSKGCKETNDEDTNKQL